jgi:hypothetical protein
LAVYTFPEESSVIAAGQDPVDPRIDEVPDGVIFDTLSELQLAV